MRDARRRLARGSGLNAEGGRDRPPYAVDRVGELLLRGAPLRRPLLGCGLLAPRSASSPWPPLRRRPLLGCRFFRSADFAGRLLRRGPLLGRGLPLRRPLLAPRPLLGRCPTSWPWACAPWTSVRGPPLRPSPSWPSAYAQPTSSSRSISSSRETSVTPFPQLRTPSASGVDSPVRSSRPTRRTARRGEGRSSGTRSARGSRRRSASPPSMTPPSPGRRPRDRVLGTSLVPAMGCSDAPLSLPAESHACDSEGIRSLLDKREIRDPEHLFMRSPMQSNTRVTAMCKTIGAEIVSARD